MNTMERNLIMMKKILIVTAALLLLFGFSACSQEPAEADPSQTIENNTGGVAEASESESAQGTGEENICDSTDFFEYEEYEDGIIITQFHNPQQLEFDKIIVPSEIDGKPVVGIGRVDSQMYVMSAIFGDCEVVIPDTVRYIGHSVFFYADGLTSVTGGANVSQICDFAFAYCENLTEVSFLDQVETVADSAFLESPGMEAALS